MRPVKKPKTQASSRALKRTPPGRDKQPPVRHPQGGSCSIPEGVYAAYIQEIEKKYLSVINSLCGLLSDQETHKVWMYGPLQISSYVLSVVSDRSGKEIEVLRQKSAHDKEKIHVLDLSSTTTQTTRSIVYRILERSTSEQLKGAKLFFQIPTAGDMPKLDKRILSRMEGTKIYFQDLDKEAYLKVFKKVVKGLKAGYLRKEKQETQDNRVYLGLKPLSIPCLPEYDYKRIEDGLAEEIERSYMVDNSFSGMELRFYRYLYGITEKSPFVMLNSLHMTIVIASTVKRVAFSNVYDEFEKKVAETPHLKRASKDNVGRRMVDLIDAGIVSKGSYTQDHTDLEKEVLGREEVFLKILLERTKRQWKKEYMLPSGNNGLVG